MLVGPGPTDEGTDGASQTPLQWNLARTQKQGATAFGLHSVRVQGLEKQHKNEEQSLVVGFYILLGFYICLGYILLGFPNIRFRV